MMKIHRIAAIGATAALVAVTAACGGTGDSSGNGAMTAAPAAPPTAASDSGASGTGATPDGVTTPADTFGPACGQLPQGNAPGSLDAMGAQPVATAASTNPLLTTLVQAVKAAKLVEILNS